jgi:hypothetical protein
MLLVTVQLSIVLAAHTTAVGTHTVLQEPSSLRTLMTCLTAAASADGMRQHTYSCATAHKLTVTVSSSQPLQEFGKLATASQEVPETAFHSGNSCHTAATAAGGCTCSC